MKIRELGLTAGLQERSIPSDQWPDNEMLKRINQELELNLEIGRQKRRLGVILTKINQA